MDDEEVATLVLNIAALADGGCVPCVQGSIDEALYRYPNLPWEHVLERIRPESTRKELEEAVESARSWLGDGGEPRYCDPSRINPSP